MRPPPGDPAAGVSPPNEPVPVPRNPPPVAPRRAARTRLRTAAAVLVGLTAAATASARQAAGPPAPDPDTILARIGRAEAGLRSLAAGPGGVGTGDVATPAPAAAGVRVTLEDVFVGQSTLRNRTPVRFLTGAVTVLNGSGRDVTVPRRGSTLTAGADVLAAGAVPEQVDNLFSPTRGGPNARTYEGGTLRVPAGGAAEFPVVFFNLGGDEYGLPDPLTLSVPFSATPADEADAAGPTGTATLDVAAYHTGLLGLGVEAVGPRGVLALLTVDGELTGAGLYGLFDVLRAQAAAGRGRALLRWTRPAADADRDAADAFVSNAVARTMALQFNTALSRRRPGTSAVAEALGLSELHLTDLPPDSAVLFERLGTVHADPADAVAAALAGPLRHLSDAEASALIRDGHPLVRPAAVRTAGPRLGPSRLPLLLGLLGDGDPAVRRAAAWALGAFDDDGARAALADAVATADPPLAAAAAESLAAAPQPAGPAALAAVLDARADTLPPEVLSVLARHPQPAWLETLRRLAADPAAPARTAALAALVSVDDPGVGTLLADAVRGDDPRVRAWAFRVLATRTDPAARRLATGYALDQLALPPAETDAARHAAGDGPPAGPGPDVADEVDGSAAPDAFEPGTPGDDPVLEYLAAVRPDGLPPLLWARFEAAGPGGRATLIRLLPRFGGPAVTATLADRFGAMTSEERAAALAVFGEVDPDRVPDVAAAALADADETVVRAAARELLKVAGTDARRAFAPLADAFAASEEKDRADLLAQYMAVVDVHRAGRLLGKHRWDEVPARKEAARAVVGSLGSLSAAGSFVRQAENQSTRAQQQAAAGRDAGGLWDGAIAYLDAALEVEPDVASVWSSRAFAKGQNGDPEGARADYRRSLELDPYDKIALTGVAILRVELDGDVAGGIAFAELGAERYGDDSLYAYNLACTYGVALKVIGPDHPDFAAYRAKTLELVGKAFDGEEPRSTLAAWASHDTDLAVLHGDPAFEALLKPDAAEE